METEALTEIMKLKVKEWALKKMVTQFQTFKKKLYKDFVNEKKNTTNHWTIREATGSLGRICSVHGIGRS
jgi:hypothetical protein